MKKSICYIITQGELGGAQRYVFDLATRMSRTYQITVLIGAEKPELAGALAASGIKVRIIKHLVRNIHPLHDLMAIFELKKEIGTLKPDIVHLSSSKAGVLGSIAGHLAGVKNIIFTAHGFAFLEPNLFLVQKIYFWAEKLVSYFRRKIITVSDYDRKEAIKWGLAPAEKFVTIHNGIDLISPPREEGEGEVIADKSTMTPSYSPPHEGEKTIVVGTIAHDYPTKDLKTLRRAFAIVQNDHQQAELKIISGVPEAAKLLPSFDIYVCSSIKEGFPYSILEAMAAGLPIVSTAVGGIPEMLNPSSGILIPPKNPQVLAEAIKYLINNPKKARQMAKNAMNRAKKFTLEEMVNETAAIYRELY